MRRVPFSEVLSDQVRRALTAPTTSIARNVSFVCILCSPSMFAERFDLAQWGPGSAAAFEAAVERLGTARRYGVTAQGYWGVG
jgi:hypothetical protein